MFVYFGMVILQFHNCHCDKTSPCMHAAQLNHIFICDAQIWQIKTHHFQQQAAIHLQGSMPGSRWLSQIYSRERETRFQASERKLTLGLRRLFLWCGQGQRFLLTGCDTKQHINTAAQIWQAVDAARDSREQLCDAQRPAMLITTGKLKSLCLFSEYQCKWKIKFPE